MIVYGKKRGFLMTVGASAEIAKRCPDHKIENWAKMISAGDDVSTIENRAALICILNEGYEQNQHYRDPSYEVDPLTIGAVLALPSKEFLELLGEALEATQPQREIESKPIKKNTASSVLK